MGMTETVSIIVPYREVPEHPDEWMIEFLESVSAQTDKRWDLIWVGDPPRQSFLGIVPMTFIPYENVYSRRINYAARWSEGAIILPLSCNDSIDPHLIERVLTGLTEAPEKLFWSCSHGMDDQIMTNSRMHGVIAYRRRFFETMNGLWVFNFNGTPRNGLEDWYAWIRIYLRGFANRGVYAGWHEGVPWRRHEEGSLNRDAICLPGWEAHTNWTKDTGATVPEVHVNAGAIPFRFLSENATRWVDSSAKRPDLAAIGGRFFA